MSKRIGTKWVNVNVRDSATVTDGMALFATWVRYSTGKRLDLDGEMQRLALLVALAMKRHTGKNFQDFRKLGHAFAHNVVAHWKNMAVDVRIDATDPDEEPSRH